MIPAPHPTANAAASPASGLRWHLRLLGDVVLSAPQGPPQRLPGRAATALLARLALAPGRAQPREVLVELLWPGVALDVGRNRLRQVLSTLKALLGAPAAPGSVPCEVLSADRLSVRLAGAVLRCDAADFEAAVRAGRHAEAAALYRGELLPGFYDDWIDAERNRLAMLAEALPPLLPAGSTGATTGAATGTPAGPGPVAAPGALNLPHYLTRLHGVDAVGARLRADVQAHRLVTLLGPGGFGKTRLAVEVAHSLAGDAAWAPPPPPHPLQQLYQPHEPHQPHQPFGAMPLPFDLVAFVPLLACQGAEARPEAVLAALLMALRLDASGQPPLDQLVALLARRRSLLVLDNFEQLVDSCGALVASLLARCPGLHLLVTSRRVLGLDGEHARMLPPLPLPTGGPGGPGTTPADGPAALPAALPVSLPDDAAMARNPAVALFADRARAVRADFHLGPGNLAAVVALVCQLQGMPLAIELAATRVRSLSPAALLALLQAGPAMAAGNPADTPALALLARSGPRAAGDARHASMLAVVHWSWGLLSPLAQRLLPRLSVFAGSFSAAAAQALGDASAVTVALALDELVAHCMLRADWPAAAWGDLPGAALAAAPSAVLGAAPGAASGASPGSEPGPAATRFALSGLIREFAAGQLDAGMAAALRARHRRWLAAWFGALPLSTPLQWVRPEVPNLAAALVAAESDAAPAQAAWLALAAQPALSAISLPPPSLAALGRCADQLTDPVLRAVTRAALARHWLVAGQPADADRLARQALAELPPAEAQLMLAPTDAPGPAQAGVPGLAPGHARAVVLTRVAHVRWRLQRDPAARAWLDEALALTAAAGLPALQASIATNLGAVLRGSDPAQALVLQRRAITLWQSAGDVHGVNVGRCNLALALLQQRAGCAEALALLDQALAGTRASGDALQHALACNLRGEALCRLGRWGEAAGAYQACVATAWAAAEPWPLVYGLWNLPRAWAHGRQPEAAARLMGFAALHAAAAGPPSTADRHDLRRLQRLCRRQAPAADVARWWAEGAALPLSQGVRLALNGPLP